MSTFLTISVIALAIILVGLFILIYRWNLALPKDHTRMKPFPRAFAQTLIVALIIAILVFAFLI